MKKNIITAALMVALCGNIAKVSAMPMPDVMDKATRYQHEIMMAVSEDTLEAEDGNLFAMENIDPLYVGSHYEVCMDTYCTEIRTDDEIVDFCPLDEVCETWLCISYGDTGREFLVLQGDKEGYVFSIPEDAENLMYLEPYYVTFNNHWTKDFKDDTPLKWIDLETWELMYIETEEG